MSCFRVCPNSEPGVSIMEFDYYHRGSDEEFEGYINFVRQVALEDFELCEKAQSNLEKGIYREGVLNPKKENGVAFYQQQVRKMVYDQLAFECEITRSLISVEVSDGDGDGVVLSEHGLPLQTQFISVL
jgi:hypothetical protein